MKQLFFILFISPSLCFGQLGVKQNAPNASLHIGIDQNLIPIKTEGIEHKTLENTDKFLVIGEDGTVKTEPIETVSEVKNLKFVFKKNVYLGNNVTFDLDEDHPKEKSKNSAVLSFKNTENPKDAVDSSGYLILPDTGSFALSLRFYGELKKREDSDTKLYFGKVTLKITNANDGTILDEIQMSWLTSNTQERMSYNVVSEIHGKKGTPIKLELIRKSGFEDNSQAKEWVIVSIAGADKVTNQNGISSVVMWKIK